MFDDKNDQMTTNENNSGSAPTTDLGQEAKENKPESASENSYTNYNYGQGSTPAAGAGSQPTYSSTPYGRSSTGYGYGQGSSSYGHSPSGTGYGQGSSGSYGQTSTGSSYGQGNTGSYSQGQFRSPSASGTGYGQGISGSSYGQGGTGYGQSRTGYGSYGSGYSYGQNSQPTYGTYQYSTDNGNGGNVPPVKPRKKHTALKVIAAIVAVALVVGGVGFGYNAVNKAFIAKNDTQTTEQVDEQSSTTVTDNSQREEDETPITTTTVTGDSLAVVTDVTGVVSEVMPAMVIIHNNYTASASYFGYVTQEEATASGSGIIVGENDTELLIATNYHVIEGADTLEVIFSDDSAIEAVVKGTDSEMDLAVIAVMLDDISSETRQTIKIATLGDSNALTLGEPAIAIGNALGYGQSVTTGVISALNREVETSEGKSQTFIQTDAAINPGNSGGALLNIQGEVIGINSNKIGGETVEGMGYAIPISEAQPIIDKLMNEQTKLKVSAEDRGYIGISGVSVTADVSAGYGIPQGVYVAEVSRGGGAEAAGISKGDVITEFDGMEIASMDDLQTRLQYYAAGTTVQIKVMRQNGIEYVENTYEVTLGAASGSSNGSDSNAGEEGEGGYDGQVAPGMPGEGSGKSGQGNEGAGGH